MATFTGTGSHNSNFTGTLTVTESSYSIPDNTSTVSYSLVLTGNSGYYFQGYYLTTKVYINGVVQDRYEQISMPSPSGGTSTYTVCSGTTTVQHDNDGTKTITVYAEMSTPATQAYLPGTINVPSGLNGTLTLTNIPRASSMTWTNLYIGQTTTFTITRANNNFTHRITYLLGDTGGIVAQNVGTSTTWTLPSTLFSELPDKAWGEGTLTLETFNNGVEVGVVMYQATYEVPASIKPTTPTFSIYCDNSSNAWLNGKFLFVSGFSKVGIKAKADPGTGARGVSLYASGLFSKQLGHNVTTYSDIINSSGTKTITVTAVDSRNRTNSASDTITFVTYTKPQITTFEAERGTYQNGSWTANVNGDHIHVHAVGSLSLTSEGNTGTKTVKIGNTSPAVSTANDYYFTNTNASTAYTVTGTITDSLGFSSQRTLTVPTVAVPFNINVNLPGAGFGMVAQTAKALEIASDWRVDVQGRLWTAQSQHYSDGTSYGLNVRDSDIINANGIWWADRVNTVDEGLHFMRSNSNWDTLYADDGSVYLMPNHTSGTATTATRILTVDDLYYKAGDTISASNVRMNGFITNSNKAVRLVFYTPKFLTNISTITITGMTGTLRGVGGYMGNSYDTNWTTASTAAASMVTDNSIGIRLDTSTAIGSGQTDSPIAYFGTLALSFS